MDLVSTKHLLLLRQLAHKLNHVLAGQLSGVCLGRIHYALDLTIDIVESLKEVHVSQVDPKIVLVTQMDSLVLNLGCTFITQAVFDINNVRLIEEIMSYRSD